MSAYPRYITPDFEPFDPLDLAQETEAVVCKGSARKYTEFYCTGVYRGISTGYLVGCYLRCIFCWVDWSRDFPERSGKLYSPQEVFKFLVTNATKNKFSKLRISGGEPTLGREHLLELLTLVKGTDYLFVLETNGILLGADRRYAEQLRNFPNIHIRVSLKAGTEEGFERRTGAKGEFYDLPFKAVEYLKGTGVSFHVAAMTDPRLIDKAERGEMLRRLKAIGYNDYFEEETCDPYPRSVARLEKAKTRIFTNSPNR